MGTTIPPSRTQLVRRGQRLEYFTITYNSVEGLVSIVAGAIAGSVSLIGFGLDSFIEVTSGAALLWRLHHDLDHSRRQTVERKTLRIVGGCFIVLAAYIAYESATTLIGHEVPERSIPGIIVAAVSVVVMPLLASGKRRVAAGIGSGAMQADSRQTDFCTKDRFLHLPWAGWRRTAFRRVTWCLCDCRTPALRVAICWPNAKRSLSFQRASSPQTASE